MAKLYEQQAGVQLLLIMVIVIKLVDLLQRLHKRHLRLQPMELDLLKLLLHMTMLFELQMDMVT